MNRFRLSALILTALLICVLPIAALGAETEDVIVFEVFETAETAESTGEAVILETSEVPETTEATETAEVTQPGEYMEVLQSLADRPFMSTPLNNYSVTEGLLLLICVLLLIGLILKLFWR